MNKSSMVLTVAGVLSVIVAILHIAIIIGGAEWYRFFGAGEWMAKKAEQGSWMPGLITLGVTAVFFLWGLYAFSGAGLIKQLPLTKLALIAISTIYILRGIGFIPALFMTSKLVNSFLIVSSLVSLAVGLVYAVGTRQMWLKL